MARPIVKREGILRAALELFVEKGISATTTRDIAERAGSAEGTMYRYFGSKDDLAVHLYVENLIMFMANLTEAANSKDCFQDKLSVMIACFCHLYDEDPTLYSYLLLSEHALGAPLPVDLQTPSSLLLEATSQAIQKNEIAPDDPFEAAALIMGTIVRLTVFHIQGRLNGPLTDRTTSLTAMCWKALAPDTGLTSEET